ncbi:MAG: hypothetical protein AAGA18_11685 [Verrucomicrobiota bacterium]
MSIKVTFQLLAITFALLNFAAASNQAGFILFEAEETTRSKGRWKLKTDIQGYTGAGYLEFTGNSPISGKASSPITFDFTIEKAGLYYLHLYCARESITEKGKVRHDLANDCYVRVKGDFDAGPNKGDAPLDMLKEDTKFFGGNDKEFAWVSGGRLDQGHKKFNAVYNFKEGKSYTLTVSGRSQLFKLDKIVFRHEDTPKNLFEGGKKKKKKKKK